MSESDAAFLGAGYFDGDTMGQAEALEVGTQLQLARVNVSLPVRVLAYDATKQQVKVQPVVQRVDPDGIARNYPPIPACPVAFPSGGGYCLTWDLSPGDLGMLVFSSAAISQWVTTGQEGVRPESARRAALSDGVFYPGIQPQTAPLSTLAGGGLSMGKADATARIHISSAGVVQVKGGSVELGPSPTGYAALAALIDTHFAAQKVWLDAHTHTSGGPGSPTSTPVLPTPASPTPPATVGSATIKVSP